MKKIFILFTITLATTLSAQSSWRMGVTLGAFGNYSRFSGGMQTANALFITNGHGTPMFGLTFRKTINNHLSFQTGLNMSSLGFEYAMMRDYNLTRPWEHFMVNRVSLGLASIPATLIWNFNPNCRNVRWFVGGGLSLVSVGGGDQSHQVNPDESTMQAIGLNSTDYMAQWVTVKSKGAVNGHIMFGIEKLFKRGTMMSLACYMNGGWTALAQSTVNYSVNGVNYSHTFTNYNNRCGLTLTYYFKNFGSAKAAAMQAK